VLRLNLATDYGLRVLLYLAHCPDRAASTVEVAEFYRISADHVRKVARQLAQAGYLRTDRGRNGGLRLNRLPGEIRVGDVVQLLEGPPALLECVLREDVCVVQPGCRLRRLLAEAGEQMLATLRGVTLADLVPPTEELVALASEPPPGPGAATSAPRGPGWLPDGSAPP